jgi:hypothetical protein
VSKKQKQKQKNGKFKKKKQKTKSLWVKMVLLAIKKQMKGCKW